MDIFLECYCCVKPIVHVCNATKSCCYRRDRVTIQEKEKEEMKAKEMEAHAKELAEERKYQARKVRMGICKSVNYMCYAFFLKFQTFPVQLTNVLLLKIHLRKDV